MSIDFAGYYPPGTTEDDVNAQWASRDEEDIVAVIRGWIRDDAGWWRRFVKADRPLRRSALIAAHAEYTYLAINPLLRIAEDERDHSIRRRKL